MLCLHLRVRKNQQVKLLSPSSQIQHTQLTHIETRACHHSGRKTLRVFRARDGVMIANYRVPSDLSSLESTTDGYSVVLGKKTIETLI